MTTRVGRLEGSIVDKGREAAAAVGMTAHGGVSARSGCLLELVDYRGWGVPGGWGGCRG